MKKAESRPDAQAHGTKGRIEAECKMQVVNTFVTQSNSTCVVVMSNPFYVFYCENTYCKKKKKKSQLL